MRVLWTHNYPPDVTSSGVFMNVLYREMQSRGIQIEMRYLGKLRGGRALLAPFVVRKLSRAFDIMHAQYGSLCGWASSWASCAKLLTLRGTDVFGIEHGSLRQRMHGQLGRWFSHRALTRYREVIVMSEQMRGMIRSLARHARVQVIPDGIALEHFFPFERNAARTQLGFSEDTGAWVLVAGVKSDNPVKRWPLAEQAMELLQRRMGKVQLKTVSGVSHEQMPLWVNASDVVLLTSTHEGWPNVIKEGLACNVPFVSTDVSDLRTVAERTESCHVVSPEPRAIAEKLEKAIEKRRHEDLRRFVSDMDVRIVANRYTEIYERLFRGGAEKLK